MRTREFFDTNPVFTHGEFVSWHTSGGRSVNTSNALLQSHVGSGRLVRVRRGLYAAVQRGSGSVDPYLVATKLADDAVVAYHGALQFHGRAYSLSRRFHYLTRSKARPFSFAGSDFVPVQVAKRLRARPDLGGGILEERHAGGTVRVTCLERALVDVLDAPDKGGGWEEVWRSLELVEFFDLDGVIEYTKRLGTAITAARVGFFLDQQREALMVDDQHLEDLRKLIPQGPCYLDPGRLPGKLVPEWNLVVPEQILSRSWEEIS